MADDRYIIDFYSRYEEDERFASKHGSVEFLTTMRYIQRYLKPGSRVLEIGAGTGRYSHALARQGHGVGCSVNWSPTTSRSSAGTHSREKRSPLPRETPWIYRLFQRNATI